MTDTTTSTTTAAAGATGSRIITALETAWSEIQRRLPEVPDVVMITGASAQKFGDVWGYHAPEQWARAQEEGRAPELFIAGELLARGPRETLQTVMHEAAHALGAARGIRTTSDSGRYHNKRFAALANEIGLTAPAKPLKRYGFTDVTLGDAAAAEWADVIAALEGGIIAYRYDPGAVVATAGEDDEAGDAETGTGEKRGGQRPAAECGCAPPRRLRLTRKQLAEGPLICGVCNERFTFVDQDDETDDNADDQEP